MNVALLKNKRMLKNFTQEKMAEDLGITNKTYNRKELGRDDFKLWELKKISEILSLSSREVNRIFFDEKLKED